MGNLELIIISIRSREAASVFAFLFSSRRSVVSLRIVWFCSAGFTKSKSSPLTIELGIQ